MSSITKTICDVCDKEIDYNDWFYRINLVSMSNSYEIGKQIMNGDYCEKCFVKRIKEELNLEDTKNNIEFNF